MANAKRNQLTTRPERFCSVARAAELFGVSEMTLYRAIHAGQFPAIRIMGRLIVPLKAVAAMEEAAIEHHGVVDAAEWVDTSLVDAAGQPRAGTLGRWTTSEF